EFALSLTRAEGRAIAERWLAEAVVSRDTARFVLPPSQGDLGPGDVVRMDDGRGQAKRWRIDRVERAGAVTVD
ncbi:phage tail protein, partial [Pseudomonas aeruginosa]|uniref:phage tail protein n=1 Tax=Pseudomonas aeruginosa TaxID=287 RepID=UPI00397B5807